MFGRQAALSATVIALVLVFCAAAFADNYRYTRNSHDDATALAIALKRSDFSAQLELTGGRTKPDESADNTICGGYRPKESDLVVTGDARTRYSNAKAGILDIESDVGLLKTATMAATDFKRQLPTMTAACAGKELTKEHLTVLTWTPLGPARCACDQSASFTFETSTNRPNFHIVWFITEMRRGRIEASVITAVGKASTDTSNLALTAGVNLQAAAIKAVSARLPNSVSSATA